MRDFHYSRGFTLIELMIVVAIIGILAAIAIPQFASYRMKGFNAAAASDAKNGVVALEAFFNDNGKYPDATPITTDGPGQETLTIAGATVSESKWNYSQGVRVGSNVASSYGQYGLITKHGGGNKVYTATCLNPTVSESSFATGPIPSGTAIPLPSSCY